VEKHHERKAPCTAQLANKKPKQVGGFLFFVFSVLNMQPRVEICIVSCNTEICSNKCNVRRVLLGLNPESLWNVEFL
jgi:hypothetical protein